MAYEINRTNTVVTGYAGKDSDGYHTFHAQSKNDDGSDKFYQSQVKISKGQNSAWAFVGDRNVGTRLLHSRSREDLPKLEIPNQINKAFSDSFPAYKNLLELSRVERGLEETPAPPSSWQRRNFIAGAGGTVREANPSAVLDIPEPWHRPVQPSLSTIPVVETPVYDSRQSLAGYLIPSGSTNPYPPSGDMFGYPAQTAQSEIDKYRTK